MSVINSKSTKAEFYNPVLPPSVHDLESAKAWAREHDFSNEETIIEDVRGMKIVGAVRAVNIYYSNEIDDFMFAVK